MNLEQAIEIVQDHQNWRRSKPPYDAPASPIYNTSPSVIGVAIDTVLDAARKTMITSETVRETFAAIDYYSGFNPVISEEALKSALTDVFGQSHQRQEQAE